MLISFYVCKGTKICVGAQIILRTYLLTDINFFLLIRISAEDCGTTPVLRLLAQGGGPNLFPKPLHFT